MHNKLSYNSKVLVVGAGLAGTEVALALANYGVQVVLLESKRLTPNPAQKMTFCGELVCTNSLKSTRETTAHGLLKLEMQKLNSQVLQVAHLTAVPAGDALAVDRVQFSQLLTQRLQQHPNIQLLDEEVSDPIAAQAKYHCDLVVVATGPLTTPALETWIKTHLSSQDFYFYDAIAPVVDADSLDFSQLYYKDRHKQINEGADLKQHDYLNAPMNKEQYELFVAELIKAEKVAAKDHEEYKYFESCLPIDVMAERGPETPRFSCMKPIGLEMADGKMPYAVVQLRRENLLGEAYNLVGFQTRLTYKEQVRVFRMIPGLQEASFIHLGSVHRNSFLHAQKLLNFDLSSLQYPQLYFAGQIVGVEGYTESAMSGLYVAQQILRRLSGEEPFPWPVETATGALLNYILTVTRPAPTNVHFGLLPPVELTKEQRRGPGKKELKKILAARRAKEIFAQLPLMSPTHNASESASASASANTSASVNASVRERDTSYGITV